MASQRESMTATITSSFPANVNMGDVVSDPESLIRLLRAYNPAFDGAQAVRAAYEDVRGQHRQGQGQEEMMMDLDDSEDEGHEGRTFSRGLTGNALVDWVTAHVNSDTLLSVDEMNQ